jgi:hypothetical protein
MVDLMKNSRRTFVKNAIGSGVLLSLSSILRAAREKRKVVVVDGHPDDPECGAGRFPV